MMNNEVFGMYVKLLFQDWIDDGIDSDPKSWLRIADFNFFKRDGTLRDIHDPDSAIAQLSKCFKKHPTKKNFVSNPRIQKTRKEQLERKKERSDSGKRGAKSRWENKLKQDSSAKEKNKIANSSANSSAIKQPIAKDGSSSSSSSSSSKKTLNTLSGKPDVVKIISFLNEKAGTNYKATTPKTVKLIYTRFGEGFTEKDFLEVIAKKSYFWKNTEDEKYLRPETLFGTKFESYLNEPNAQKKKPILREA